eukprot:sb/3474106/
MHGILAMALIIFYLAYLIQLIFSPPGILCRLIGVFVHWSTLCVFLAMLLEALTVYMAIVVVFNSHISNIVIKAATAVWGIPTVVVGIVVGITKGSVYSDQKCLLIPPFSVYLQSIPVIAIITVNSFIFGGVLFRTIRKQLDR